MKARILFAACLLFAGLCSQPAFGATKNWIGSGAGGAGTDFNTATNWNPVGVPVAGDDVVMPVNTNGTVNVSASILNLQSLQVNVTTFFSAGLTFTMTVNSGVALSFTGNAALNVSTTVSFTAQLQFIINSSATVSCNNLSASAQAPALSAGSHIYIINRGNFTVNGTATTSTVPGFITNSCKVIFGTEDGAVTTFNGNVDLSTPSTSNADSIIFAGKNVTSTNGRAHSTGQSVFNSNLTFGPKAYAYANSLPAWFIFDAAATQTLTNNSGNTINFSNFQVGSANSPTATLAGSGNFQLTSSASSANIVVNNNSILDLATRTLNRSAAGGSISLNNTATLKLAGGTGGQGNTSNFPSNFSTFSFNSTSTVEYNAAVGTPQTIYGTPTYGNLTLTRPAVSGTATRNSGSALTVVGNLWINGAFFDVTTSNFATTVGGNWTNTGTYQGRTSTTTFNTATNATISGSSATAFYNFVMNKGTSTATTLDVNGTGLVTVTVNSTTTTISNGLLRVNSGGSFSKAPSGGTPTGSVQINSTAGVHVNGGTFNVSTGVNASGGVNNDGLFRITSGNSTIGNSSGNSLSTSNAASFDQQGGTLNIAGRFEVTGGTVSISAGTMNLCTVGNTLNSFGSFHLSLSTNLTMSGSPVINFQRASLATTPIDLNILNSSGTKTITGGTFQFGNASTPAVSTFRCYSDNIALYNTTLNTTNNPAALMTSNLTVNNIFSLNGTGGFGINGNTLTLNGTVTGTGTITGSPTSNLVVNGTGSLGTLYFTLGSQLLNNFTLDRTLSGLATLGSNLAIGNVTALTNGAFAINGNTLTLNGTITGTGTLTGSATSNLAAGGTGALGTLYFTTGSQLLNNFTLNRTLGGSATMGTNVAIGGVATLTNGEFVINGNTLSLNGTITGTVAGTLTGSSTSNLSIGGTSNGSLGTVYFTLGARQLNLISIDRKDGLLNIGRAILGTDLTASNITLTYGVIATGNNLFTWDHTGVLTTPLTAVNDYEENSTTYTNSFIATCDDTGTPLVDAAPLIPFLGLRGFRINNVGGGVDTYFPVGASFNAAGPGLPPAPNRMMLRTNYTPQHYTVLVNYGDLGGTPAPRVNRIWYVKADNATDAGSATMKLFFTKRNNTGFPTTQNELEDGYVYSDTRLLQKDYLGDPNFLNISDIIDLIDFTSNNLNTEIFAQYTIPLSAPFGITRFNRFSAGNFGGIILPVTITGFKATAQGKHILLDWMVLNESNMDRYEVERSTDALHFISIAKAAALNNGNAHSYSATDLFPVSGSNYYRVKSVDKNGKISYTQVVVVNFSEGKTGIAVYPNPVHNRSFNLLISNIPHGKYEFVIYNNAGQKIMRQSIQYSGGLLTAHISLPQSVKPEIYPIRLFNDAYHFTGRVVVAGD